MRMNAAKLIRDFGYAPVFGLPVLENEVSSDGIPPWISEHNRQSLKFSISNYSQDSSITSLLINHPKLLLRKK